MLLKISSKSFAYLIKALESLKCFVQTSSITNILHG